MRRKQTTRVLTGPAKLQFSRIHNSIIFILIDAKFAVEVPAYQGKLHIKFKENQVAISYI